VREVAVAEVPAKTGAKRHDDLAVAHRRHAGRSHLDLEVADRSGVDVVKRHLAEYGRGSIDTCCRSQRPSSVPTVGCRSCGGRATDPALAKSRGAVDRRSRRAMPRCMARTRVHRRSLEVPGRAGRSGRQVSMVDSSGHLSGENVGLQSAISSVHASPNKRSQAPQLVAPPHLHNCRQ